MTNSDKNPPLNDLYSKLILIGSWQKKPFSSFFLFLSVFANVRVLFCFVKL